MPVLCHFASTTQSSKDMHCRAVFLEKKYCEFFPNVSRGIFENLLSILRHFRQHTDTRPTTPPRHGAHGSRVANDSSVLGKTYKIIRGRSVEQLQDTINRNMTCMRVTSMNGEASVMKSDVERVRRAGLQVAGAYEGVMCHLFCSDQCIM